jgi:hypothetical protein
MKKSRLLGAVCATTISFFTASSHASLVDRGSGLIYDPDLNITWLQNANYGAGSLYDDGFSTTDGRMTFASAVVWADQLVFAGYSNWRLPTVTDTGLAGCDFSYSGTDCGYNVNTATGEIAHLYFDELGNKAFYDTAGVGQQAGNGLTNAGPFTNLQSNIYWSGTEYAADTSRAWSFYTDRGAQSTDDKPLNIFAWAVADGDVFASTVPIPPALWLFGSGLLGLIGIARKKAA